MLKKIGLCMFMIVALAMLPVYAANNAKTATTGLGITMGVVVADSDTGKSAQIDSDGGVHVRQAVETNDLIIATGASVEAACNVRGFVLRGIAASDYALIKDGDTTVLDVIIGLAADTKVITLPGTVAFDTDVFVTFGGSLAEVLTLYTLQ